MSCKRKVRPSPSTFSLMGTLWDSESDFLFHKQLSFHLHNFRDQSPSLNKSTPTSSHFFKLKFPKLDPNLFPRPDTALQLVCRELKKKPMATQKKVSHKDKRNHFSDLPQGPVPRPIPTTVEDEYLNG